MRHALNVIWLELIAHLHLVLGLVFLAVLCFPLWIISATLLLPFKILHKACPYMYHSLMRLIDRTHYDSGKEPSW